MKKYFILNRLNSMFILLSLLAVGQPAIGQNLRISVSNIKSAKGNIMVAVYIPSQKFPGDEIFAGAIKPVPQTGTMTLVIEDLPFGEYAVSVFHDENSNKTLDSNFLKIPTEPYGFSNNARGRFGPPDFEDARIIFSDDQQVFDIRLK